MPRSPQDQPLPPDGPYYDDLETGLVFPVPPPVTLDAGLVSAYRTIVGDHWAPGLDHRLGAALSGAAAPLVHPALVLVMSTGASTVATKRVIANLFYRDVILHRPVHLGQTLRTETRVLAMADASPKPGVAPRGKVLLGMTTTADDEVVLEYQRCALLPCRGEVTAGHADDLGPTANPLDLATYERAIPGHWKLDPLGPTDGWDVGQSRPDDLRDVVDNATGLVRLSHNLAAAHRDAERSPYPVRLVYGGHTVALAHTSLDRTVAGMATLLGWHSCNHTAPVFEGETLGFEHTLIEERVVDHGRIRAVRVVVDAERDGRSVTVLDWTPVIWTT
ncbi:MAG: acyl dehydratase [Actinomycetota bacterium]